LEDHNSKPRNNEVHIKLFDSPIPIVDPLKKSLPKKENKVIVTTVICDVCGKICKDKDRLKIHFRLKHTDRNIVCKICNRTLKKENLKRHIMAHTGDSKYEKCDICPERFRSYQAKIKHKEEVHDIPRPTSSCHVCPKKFNSKSDLSKHIKKIHLGVKNHKCNICDAEFFEKIGLNHHMSSHTGEKKYKCEYCSKGFCRRYNLKLHIRSHTQERPYKCEICFKGFNQTGNYRSHMLTHK
jgi:KRAB domain-containing zinc finger protein